MQRQEKKLVTLEQVQETILSWSIRFKEAGYTPEQLKLIAREYHEDLVDEYVTPKQFAESVRIVRKKTKFFPKMAEILDAVQEFRDEENRLYSLKRQQISAHTSMHDITEEEAELNKKRVRAIAGMLAGKMSIAEATKIVEKKVFEFRRMEKR